MNGALLVRCIWLISFISLGILTGCDQLPEESSVPHDESARNPSGEESIISEEEVEKLLALPYAGWSEQQDAEAGEGLVYIDQERSYRGYTLYSSFGVRRAYLIDHDGDVMRSWSAPDHVNILGNGDILAFSAREPRFAMRLDFNGEILWKKEYHAHHEMTTTPDGGLMLLTAGQREVAALPETEETTLRDNEIVLLTPEGERLDSVSIYDIVSGRPDLFPLKPSRVGKKGWVDLFHCNSLEWMHQEHLYGRHPLFGPNNVLVCSRKQDRIFVVNMQTRELVWAWGAEELSGPHDAQVLADGNILLLDNGLSKKRSRAVEMDPLTGRIVWEYQASNPPDFFTSGRGSVQRLANGNTLICNADHGEIFEVTKSGETVWRYLCPERNDEGKRSTLARAERLESEFIGGLLERHGNQRAKGAKPAP